MPSSAQGRLGRAGSRAGQAKARDVDGSGRHWAEQTNIGDQYCCPLCLSRVSCLLSCPFRSLGLWLTEEKCQYKDKWGGWAAPAERYGPAPLAGRGTTHDASPPSLPWRRMRSEMMFYYEVIRMPGGYPTPRSANTTAKQKTPRFCISTGVLSAWASCSCFLFFGVVALVCLCLEETVGLSCAPCYPYLAQRIDQPRASLGLCCAMLRSRPASTPCLVISFGECMRVIVNSRLYLDPEIARFSLFRRSCTCDVQLSPSSVLTLYS
jgi:hypothetical protein